MRPWQVPEKEIRFAAKTGFLTKKLWDDFFAPPSKSWRPRRWRSFVDSGVFLPHPSSLATHVLVPNPKHGDVRRLVGGEVSTAPYIGHLNHDEISARILLVLYRAKIIQSFTTEMEQKRHFQE